MRNTAGTEDRNKRLLIGGFVLLFAGLIYYNFQGTGLFPWESTPAPASSMMTAAPVSVAVAPAGNRAAAGGPAGTAKALGTTSAGLDPTLHMQSMLVTESVVYSGTGRNIFSATAAPPTVVQVVKPIAPPRPTVQAYVAPVPTGPAPPPPIDLKFFGTATSASGVRQAFLLHGEDVYLATAGDIVARRYRVIAVAVNSIQVEDMTNNNKQSLPLQAN
jgi:hypothetical protein